MRQRIKSLQREKDGDNSPLSTENFHKVIGQSGSALAGWAFDNEPEKHAKDIANL
jgi:hypothetical protein